jgi:hypothetical protein
MMMACPQIPVSVLVTEQNFDEEMYLASNPDVAEAIRDGRLTSARTHFEVFAEKEQRRIRDTRSIEAMRVRKMDRLRPFLEFSLPHTWQGAKANFLTDELRKEAGIFQTDNVSSNRYDSEVEKIIQTHAEGLILDCGAGLRDTYFDNVINFEIVDYDTTDVLGVGEQLPFKTNTFDAVISVAVLEHVRNPFECAREISRVLKPGGQLYCCVPFLQPLHGYPNHYFNATHQGIQRLFEETLEVQSISVPPSTHPIWSLTWILKTWADGLPEAVRSEFLSLPLSTFLHDPQQLLPRAFCGLLPKEEQLKIASATVLKASKPIRPAKTTAD